MVFSFFFPQNKLNDLTENILKLYIKDSLKTKFQNGDYIAVKIFPKEIYIDTNEKHYMFHKISADYEFFKYQNKNILIFCFLNSTAICKKYFNTLNLINCKKNEVQLLKEEVIPTEIDDGIKPWNIRFDQNNKIIKISGKIVEAEINNPKDFKKFLKKYSKLRLYQMEENGVIVYPKPHIVEK